MGAEFTASVPRTITSAVTALGILAAMSACGTARTTEPVKAPSVVVASADLAPAKRIFDVGAPIGSLAFDTATGTVWLTRATSEGALLDAVDEGGLVAEVKLPGGQLGGQSKVKLSPDGSVWVTDDYRLIRYDRSRRSVSSVTLEPSVVGELPGAQDPNTPTPGTWVSAITFDVEGNAVVARHNVARLFRFSPSLGALATIEVAPEVAGPSELTFDDQGIHGYSGTTGDGAREVSVASLSNLKSQPGNDPNVMQSIRDNSVQVFAQGHDGMAANVEESPDGLAVVWGSPGAEHRLAMPRQTFQQLAPDGKTFVPAITWTHPTVLLPTPDGALWFVADVDGQALFRIS